MQRILRWTDDLSYFTVSVIQGQNEHLTTWKRQYFSDYLAFCYSLFASIMAGTSFVISGYQVFVSDKSMLKKLYGESTVSIDKLKVETDQ